MSRYVETVFYNFNDICHIGEYNGKYHTHGYCVNMKTADGKRLKWYTTISPQQLNGVEKYVNETVKISYTYVREDDFGNIIIKNVRFLKN